MARIVQMRGGDYTFELPHTIQSLTYGPLTDTSGYEKDYELKGFNTLKGYMGKEERDDGYSGPYQHAYSITAIPNIFDRAFGRLLETFQYTASYYHKRDMTLNAIVFR